MGNPEGYMPPEIIEGEEAKKELQELGLEALPENIKALTEQKKTTQHPKGYEEIVNNLNNPDELKKIMSEKGIKSIIHSEGASVWDHVKMAIGEIEPMQISDETKKDLKLILLYHDLGKTTAGQNEKNIKETEKKVAKGELHQTMIGHHKERLEDIEKGFQANGVKDRKLDIFMTVVENHMNTSLLEQDPRKTVQLFESFSTNDEEREKVVELLTLVLQVDGNATQHIDLVDGELKNSKNEKKLELNFVSVWQKYEEGIELLRQEAEKQDRDKANANLEISILGQKISDYAKSRGKTGKDIGKAIEEIRKIITGNPAKSPEEIKKIIDETSLSSY